MNKTELQEKLLQETKYSRWYLNIIENAQKSNRIKLDKLNEDYAYYENHHILPNSIFKEYSNLKDNKWNAVLLTPKEHFICHICIWKHYKSIQYTHGEIKMSWAMTSLNSMGKYNSSHYEHFRLNLTFTKEHRNNLSKAGKGIPKSEEHNRKNSEAHKGKKQSTEAKRKNSEAHKGIKNHFYGEKHTEQTKEKMRKPKPKDFGKQMSEARTKKGRVYKLLNVFDENFSKILYAREIGDISDGLSKKSKQNYLGKSKWGSNNLTKNGKSELIGLYTEEIIT